MSSVTAGLGKQIGSSRFISSSTAALFTSSSFSNSSISNSNPISFSPSLFSSVTPRSSLARLSSPVLNPFSFSVRYFSSELTKVPTLGDSITEGTIVKWSKNVGDSVENDEVIVVIETDKVSVDIRATKGGVLKAQLAKEGDTVQVGADLAEIETGGGGGGGGAQPAATSKSSPAPSTDSSSSSSKDSKSADKSSVRGAQPEQHVFTPPSKEDEAIKSAQKPTQQQQTKASTPATSPSSTPAASSKGKDESSKKASSPSPSSSISPLPSSSGSPSRNSRRVPMSRMRQTIASRLKQAQNTAASLTTFNEIDMTNIMELRNKHKDEFLEKTGIKLGFMSAFVKAATAALQKIPDVNASIEGNDFVYHDYVDISVAVSTPTGLVVPVLRNTETLSFAQIEAAIAALGAKARKNQIAIEDMVGGTFTISNGGVYGSLFGTPILNPPQSAILGMHGIFKRPVVIGDKIEIRPMMYVALTYDHRVIDGGTAVTFLKEIKTGVEDPTRLLLNI